MRSVVIVGAGTFGASLAWWLARAGDDGDARRPVRARRPARHVGRRVAPDPLRPRPGRRLHRLGAPRAHAVARARGRVRRGRCSSSAGSSGSPTREDGWEAQSDRRRSPRRGSRASGSRPRRARALFPSFDPGGLAFLLHEPEAGVLRAQRAVRALARQAAAHGATVLRARATPDGARVRLDDGRVLEGDVVVWACGAVARRPVRPSTLAIRSTRQELFFFDGGPAWRGGRRARVRRLRPGDLRHARPRRPRRQGRARLRRPAARPRRRAARRDAARARRSRARSSPSASPRSPTRRSPARRCCRYELTPDAHFVAAPHPEHPSVWLLGGGSGHGFKHGPAMAERVAAALAGGRAAARALRARATAAPGGVAAHRWRDDARRRRVGPMHDYLIVGAGSAGCALAARLTEDPDVSVLLVEAGPPDSEEALHIPVAFSKLYRTPFDWDYISGPEPALGRPRALRAARARARRLVVAQRDDLHPRQPARLRRVGTRLGLGRRAPVLPARRGQRARRERAARRRRPAVSVSDGRSSHLLAAAWLRGRGRRRACRANDDFNGPRQDGVGRYQLTQRGGMRCSAAVAYLHPALARPNLTLMPGALVTRVLFEGDRAIGVEALIDGVAQALRAEREVVLSAGAYNSPAAADAVRDRPGRAPARATGSTSGSTSRRSARTCPTTSTPG